MVLARGQRSMTKRLRELLDTKEDVRDWYRAPVKEWHGFSVHDMIELRMMNRVLEWFATLSDKDIYIISNKRKYTCKRY